MLEIQYPLDDSGFPEIIIDGMSLKTLERLDLSTWIICELLWDDWIDIRIWDDTLPYVIWE